MSSLSMYDDSERSSSVSEIRLEVTDDEIRKLSEYFQKSREEIQKKVDSLMTLEVPIKNVKQEVKKSPVPAIKMANGKSNSIKGRPIDLATATSLRELSVGSCVHSFSNEWKRAKFQYRPEDSELAYGLYSEKNGSKGLVISVQAVLIKNLISMGYQDLNGNPIINSEWRNERKILRPNEAERKTILTRTLAEILWKAGEEKFACVVVNSQLNCFEMPSLTNSSSRRTNYVGDGITERLHLYEFKEFKSLEDFVKKNLNAFQKDEGCILFLYSLFLSRRIEKVKHDLQGSVLIGDMEDCRLPLYNLVLTGYATPYLHNGSVYYDSDGKSLDKPLHGIKDRNNIGLLYWDSKESDDKRTEVGSMLKTPKYPVWLAIMGKNLIAILFNTNIDLINNWRFEQYFSLYFYSGLKKQEESYKLEIDTRYSSELGTKKKPKSNYFKLMFNDEERESEIFSLINSKWPGSKIENADGKELMALL